MHTDRFITAARTMLNTPWVHTGRTPSEAVDCVGLLVLACQGAGYRCDDLLHYSRYPDGEQLVAELAAQLDPVDKKDAQPGDVLVFSFARHKKVPQHVGIMTDKGVIHAWQTQNKVVEHCLDDHWVKRITHVFRLRDDRWQQ